MQFSKLYCNGRRDPLGVGSRVLLQWNYTTDGRRNETQTAFRLDLYWDGGSWSSERIDSAAMQFELTGRVPLIRPAAYRWQVTVWTSSGEVLTSPEACFETAIDDLAAAPWITCGVENEPAAPVFSTKFTADPAEIRRARAYVFGLGLIHPTLNGKDCTDALLLPPNARYDYRCLFETLNLTPHLLSGENCFSVQLGGGYNPDYSQWGYRYDAPKGLRAIIELTDRQGQVTRVVSGSSWCWSDSPITANGLYPGEEYDATLRGFSVHPAVESPDSAPRGTLIPDEMPPVRVVQTLEAIQSWPTEGGVLYDFGVNVQGICRLTVEADKGTVISLLHSEMIWPDGRPDIRTNRGARATDIYTCSGDGREVWSPRFTYHGFRYVLVKGAEAVRSFRLEALHISADVEWESTFTCSEPTLNRIHELCCRSIRSNMVTIPTDCPVRDERTPCLMDSQAYEDAAMFNFNMHAYYAKWLDDISLQRSEAFDGFSQQCNMDWHGDSIMLCYRLYLFYGDIDPVRRYYPQMKRDVLYWLDHSDNGLWSTGYGDWCLPNDDGWENYFGCVPSVNTALLHAYTGILAEFARLLGHDEDIPLFEAGGEKVRAALKRHLTNEKGEFSFDRQPSLSMPLFYGALTGEERIRALTALADRVEQDGFFDSGIFGTRTLLPLLAEAGRVDLAMDILKKSTYPGYGNIMAMGATSLWEQWAYFGGMHSHSHAMQSSIDAAFYSIFCGLTPDEPGFGSFTIQPCLPEEMRFASCAVATASGRIKIAVERIHDAYTISLCVPPNTHARLIFPDFEGFESCRLFDGERPMERSRTLTLGSGRYCLRLVPEKYLNGFC